jgi:CHAT domain-containing protein
VGILERSRAQGLLALLAEREIVFSADVPAELERQRRLARADYQRLFAELGWLAPDDQEGRRQVREQLEAVRLRQDEIEARVRANSPRLADLHYPRPLEMAGVQEALEPGDLLLYFSLGEERSAVVTVAKDDVTAAFLPTTLDEVGGRLRRLRARLSDPASPQESVEVLARSLSDLLLTPVASRIVTAERVLLVPDGPLWLLPFAVLSVPGHEATLAERMPSTLIASATVFRQLKQGRGHGPATAVVAFGDPLYPAEGSASERRGLQLAPLPATRREVENLRALFDDTATVHLGPAATEEAVLAVGSEPNIIHFAVHGFVDERFPLESCLAFSIPTEVEKDGEDGLLQAWEVFEQLRIDADLVTLSACQTGLGKDLSHPFLWAPFQLIGNWR